MASIAIMLGGAPANAFAFNGPGYLFQHLSKHYVDEDRRRHDRAIEKLEKPQMEWST